MTGERKMGIFFLAFGGILFAAACLLFSYNRFQNAQAGSQADEALTAVKATADRPLAGETETETAGSEAGSEMTVVEIDGYGYIGYLSIPVLGLELPVMSEVDGTRLKKAPCRYYGSTKTADLVIAAHNYARHFGGLHTLKEGDSVTFTDMDGISYSYRVAELETLEAEAVAEMVESGYPLTLYTCTFGGEKRVTVRCRD